MKKIIYLLSFILIFISCDKKDEPTPNNEFNNFKIEVVTSENALHYSEVIVFQLNGKGVSKFFVKNQPQFEESTVTEFSKILQLKRKANLNSIYEVSNPIAGFHFNITYLLDSEIEISDDDMKEFVCTIKVFKNNVLHKTLTHTFNKNTIENIFITYPEINL